ncbi:MAG: RidA family protein [Syntrophomonadaceae bacterium]|nr:RidA family protein [Syntrophomonadaceae bacterium]MDD3888960.1 RidA family protein [Syntrophomonadaceae bacterium]MDD4548682.1 RidA family protein [Syntrophomonadaceae bacterium]
MSVEKRLNELGLVIPETNKPVAAYVPGIKAGEFIYVSGQLPIKEGKVLYQGKLGRDLSTEEGQAAAQLAAINCLAVIKSCIGDWENLLQIVKINGYIQSENNFYDQALVLNGASNLLEKIFDEKGKHARAAVGVNSLPLNSACEVEMIAMVK